MSRLRDIQYHFIVCSPGATGGPGKAKLELDPDALNLVWQASFNGPGRAAFALARYNPKLALIDFMIDHLQIFREDSRATKQVFAGKLVKPSYSGSDAVIYAWDYLAFLQRSRTGFRTLYPQKLIGSEIVDPEIGLAIAADNSVFAFLTKGTIEDPLADDDLTPIKTNADFGLVDFTRLFAFYSLAEMAMANTAHTVKFEITREAPHTFNFWRDRSSQNTKYAFSSPGNLVDVGYDPGFDEYRNDLAAPQTDPDTGEMSEFVAQAPDVSTSAYRRLQDAVSLKTLLGSSGTTATDQGQAALQRMLRETTRVPKTVLLTPRQGEITPFDGWELGDDFRVTIQAPDKSGDEYDGYLKAVSIGCAWSPAHGELVQLYARAPET